jgi:pseudaminic acid cytidylyltransferase
MRNIAIIPARGGSKRIPLKNIKNFLGKPIISYSIENALKSCLFDEIMVSTEDKKIAEIALQHGAKVPFLRSESTANDFAGIADVLLEVIEKYEQQGQQFENICCILATAPLIQSNDIISGYNKLTMNDFDSVCPVVQFSYPILRSIKIDNNGYISMNWPEHYETRSQDLPLSYHDSGTFYWIKTEKLKEYKKLITNKSGGIIVNETTVQDIDTDTDWILAELKYQLHEK